jgi:hypothetical protein
MFRAYNVSLCIRQLFTVTILSINRLSWPRMGDREECYNIFYLVQRSVDLSESCFTSQVSDSVLLSHVWTSM